MAKKIVMPKMGLTMTEGTIEEWKFKEGDAVKKGDILFSVATDKLTNDIECETDGILLKIILKEGETAPCKAVIAYIGEAGETIEAGEGSDGGADNEEAKPQAVPDSAAKTVERAPGAPVLASPAAKKLAKEKGVDLAVIPGTGPKGRITLEDVERYMVNSASAEEAHKVKVSPTAAKMAAEMQIDVGTLGVDGRVMKADVLAASAASSEIAEPVAESNDLAPVKVNPLRRAIAANMSASWATSPRVTLTRPVDATAMKALRAGLRDQLKEKGIKLTYNHIIMKVSARALSEFPDVNASFSDNMLTRHIHANVGLAVAKGDGLIVPNVKKCELKSLAEIAQETEALIEATRSGKIGIEDMTGGTFTITNLGSFGITHFSPIINQPELAILGVCDIVDTPVVRDGVIVIRPMMNLCLTADHRVVDGVMAARFLGRIAELLENPTLLLA